MLTKEKSHPSTPPDQADAPRLGAYQVVSELSEDAFGICYHAAKNSSTPNYLLRILSPSITNSPNFLVRFELLKSTLPKLKISPYLLSIEELGHLDNLYFIAYSLPNINLEENLTLNNFTLKDSPHFPVYLEQIASCMIKGFQTLSQFKSPIFKEGLPLNNPCLSDFWLLFEDSLIAKEKKLRLLITGYVESFLFYGDEKVDLLSHKLKKSLTPRKNSSRSPSFIYQNEGICPSRSRNGIASNFHDYCYFLGATLYFLITGQYPKGQLQPPSKNHSRLSSLWDEFIQKALSNSPEKQFKNWDQALDLATKIANQRTAPSPKEKWLNELEIPENMSLIAISDKVELGNSEGKPEESPRFKASIAPFFMDQTCVTNAQMQAFLPQFTPSSYSPGPTHPATGVSLNMAMAYCRYRDKKEGLPEGTYRLPTEFEWEAACRGSSGKQYPWDSGFNAKLCHVAQGSEGQTCAVKAYPSGRFGLYEMLGNVWEWTQSRFVAHPFSEYQHPAYGKKVYTVKGGCFLNAPDELRASARSFFTSMAKKPFLSFRCVRDLPKYE